MSSHVLAIETSTPHGHIALLKDGELVFEERFISQRSHNSQLFGPVQKALAVAANQVDTIVVGTGPGSYTGVRIGISAAQGLAMSLGAQVVGLSSVYGIESNEPFSFCGDARRGQFYAVPIRAEGWPSDVTLMSEAEFLENFHDRRETRWVTFDRKAPLSLEGIDVLEPCAVALAKRWRQGEGGSQMDLVEQPLEPIYLSEAFITQAKSKITR